MTGEIVITTDDHASPGKSIFLLASLVGIEVQVKNSSAD
jgi:hypothetical protein